MDRSDIEHSNRQYAGRQPFDMEGFIGYILLAGVILSMVLVTAGVGWHWIATGKLGVTYLIKGVNLFQFLSAIAQKTSSKSAWPDLLVNLGIGILMLTPYVRVLGSVIYFALVARNWKYTIFTTIVLGILTYSLFIR